MTSERSPERSAERATARAALPRDRALAGDQPLSGTGGQLIVRMLETHGTRRIWCVPGESFLAVLDALHQHPIHAIACRHESGAAMMAEAEGKLTGEPGVCFVTRGPGVTNASAGLHIAQQDSTPMILFIGQIRREEREREAFQEIDYRRMLGPLTKWVAEIDSVDRIPEMVTRAYQVATSGRPGPVALALPEDMLRDHGDGLVRPRPYRPVRTAPTGEDLGELVSRLRVAQRPLVLVGGRVWRADAFAQFRSRMEAWGLPVATSFRYQDSFDHGSPVYVGDVGIGINPALAQKLREADLILAVGERLGEMTTQGYTLLAPPRPAQSLIHVYPGPEELGRVYQPDLAILSDVNAFAAAMPGPPPELANRWQPWLASLREAWRHWIRPPQPPMPGPIDLAEVVTTLRRVAGPEAILTNGAGNYSSWLHRFVPFTRPGTQLAPTSGSMGYGLPAAIAAAMLNPGRPVVALAGDGCFLMTGQELATAVAQRLRLVVLVIDNGMYGTIRMHQERTYPGRESATALANPDFAALAAAYGCLGLRVDTTQAFAPALEAALAHDGPSLIHLPIDPDAITPTATLSGLRRQALGSAAEAATAPAAPAASPAAAVPRVQPAPVAETPATASRRKFSLLPRPPGKP